MQRLNTRPLVTFSTGHPWLIIIISFSITILLLLPIRNLRIEPDVKSLLPPSVQAEMKNNSPEQSTEFDNLAIMISGSDLYTVSSLKLFEQTYTKIAETLPVGKLIDPFSQTMLEKAGSRLKIIKLSPNGKAPETQKDVELFRKRLKASPFTSGLITSSDRDVLVVYFYIHKGQDYRKMMDTIQNIVLPLREIFEVTITGTIPFSAKIEGFLTKDFAKLQVFVLITILISYYLGFRSRRALFIPMLLVISGTVFALGGMALAGFKLTMISIVSPPLVLTLGSSYSIHVLNAYYTQLRKRKEISKKEAIVTVVTGISSTIILTSLTTVVGLLSLLLASIQQTREFAISTSLGIFFTALLSITLLPALLALQKIPNNKKLKRISNDLLSRFLINVGPRLIRGKRTAVIIITVIILGFILVYPGISFNTNPYKYFPEKSVVIRDNTRFLLKIGGFEEISITFKPKTSESGFFLKPEVLRNIYEVENKIKTLENVSFIFSFPSYLEYAGKTMKGENYLFTSRGLNILVSRLFHTTAGSEADRLINKEFNQLTIKIKIYNKHNGRPIDEGDTMVLKKELTDILTNNVNKNIDWKFSGMSLAFLDLSHQMRRDFLVSTLGALLAIGFIAFIAFKSLMQSIFALIPLLAGIFSSLILMALFKIPLDMTTIMVSCISIGVGVDDSIHFLLQYHQNKTRFPDDPEKAVYETLIHTGRPIVLTTVSIVAGLLFLGFAQFQPIRYFGLLIVFTLTTACLATLFLLPPLLIKKIKIKDTAK